MLTGLCSITSMTMLGFWIGFNSFFFPVLVHTRVCSWLCVVAHNSSCQHMGKPHVHKDWKQGGKSNVHKMGTYSEWAPLKCQKPGLSLSCARSCYHARALRRDRERVTLSLAKSDTGFHMLGGGFFFPPSLPFSPPTPSLSLVLFSPALGG